MINVYYGELTISPIPLELTFNVCSHRCFYCYANLNDPNRVFSLVATKQFLETYKDQDTLSAQLLAEGYPVLLSNRCDPFATSNHRESIQIIETMADLGIPLTFQTKGGKGIDNVLEFLPPSAWYITIEMPEAVRARIAPAAPTIQSRLELVEKLVNKGHVVVVAVNPCAPEWLPDPRPLLQAIKARGAWGVWVERLHLSKAQARRMRANERKAIGAAVIKRARKKGDPGEIAHLELTRQIALDEGLEIFSTGQPNPSRFLDPYRDLYPKTFPTLQDWVNRLNEDGLTGSLLSFDQYANFMCARLPYGVLPIQSYLGATSQGLWKRFPDIPKEMRYRELLRYTWLDPWTKYSLVQSPAFAYAALWDSNDPPWVQVTDDNDLPYLMYSPDGFSDYYCCVGAG